MTLLVFIESNGVGAIIDWIAPVCKYIKERHDLDIIFFFLRLDRNYADTLANSDFYRDCVNFITEGRVYDMRQFLPGWGRMILKSIDCLRKINNVFLKKGIGKIERFLWLHITTDQVKQWMNQFSSPLVTIKDGYGYRGKGSKFQFFYDLVKKRGKIISLPPGLLSTNFPNMWVDLSFDKDNFGDGRDYFFVETELSVKYFKNTPRDKIIVTGAPKFDQDWLSYNRKYMENKHKTKEGKTNILFLLKDENSVVFVDIDFARMIKEVIQAINRIDGAFLIIKPHPRQDVLFLKALIRRYAPELNFEINYDPILSLSLVADLIVSLPTGGLLDAVISGRNVIEYFDYKELNHILKNKFEQIPKTCFGGISCLDKEGNLTSVFRAYDFVDGAEDPDSLFKLICESREKNLSQRQKRLREFFPAGALKKTSEIIMEIALSD